MNVRKSVEDRILYILFTYTKELISNNQTDSAFDIIRKHGLKFEDFSDITNQALYKSIQNQLYEGLPEIDFLNIVKFRPKEYRVFEQQADQYLGLITALITTNFAPFSDLDALIYKLKEFNMRDFWRYYSSIINGVNFEQVNVMDFGDDIIAKYQEFQQRLMAGILTKTSQSGNAKDELARKMQEVATGATIGIPIHLNNFQEFFGGWQAPDLIVIGARPSMGKTSFILAASWESCKIKKGAFFSYEMSVNQLRNKIASSLTGIPYKKIHRAQLTQEEFNMVIQAYDLIDASNLLLRGTEFNLLEDFKTEARKLYRLGLLEFIVIDYLQLMKTKGGHGNREQEVANISRELKLLAIELNVPIIALSQLKRENDDGKRPGLKDLRESGAIEQDADIVGFLFREAYYMDKNLNIPYEKEFHTEFIVAKGRNDGTTVLYFFNDVKNSKILEADFNSNVINF